MTYDLKTMALRPGEREELETLTAHIEKFSEEIKRDPSIAHRFLEEVGFFDQKDDEGEATVEAKAPAANGNSNGHAR